MTAQQVRDADRTTVVRRFARPVYQTGAALSLIAAVQAVIVPLVAGAPLWSLALAPILLAYGTVLTTKSIPHAHVVFPTGRP